MKKGYTGYGVEVERAQWIRYSSLARYWKGGVRGEGLEENEQIGLRCATKRLREMRVGKGGNREVFFGWKACNKNVWRFGECGLLGGEVGRDGLVMWRWDGMEWMIFASLAHSLTSFLDLGKRVCGVLIGFEMCNKWF